MSGNLKFLKCCYCFSRSVMVVKATFRPDRSAWWLQNLAKTWPGIRLVSSAPPARNCWWTWPTAFTRTSSTANGTTPSSLSRAVPPATRSVYSPLDGSTYFCFVFLHFHLHHTFHIASSRSVSADFNIFFSHWHESRHVQSRFVCCCRNVSRVGIAIITSESASLRGRLPLSIKGRIALDTQRERCQLTSSFSIQRVGSSANKFTPFNVATDGRHWKDPECLKQLCRRPCCCLFLNVRLFIDSTDLSQQKNEWRKKEFEGQTDSIKQRFIK